MRRGEQDGAAGRTVLEGLEDAEEQALAGRGEQVNAIEIGEAGKGGGIGVGYQPFAGVAALEAGGGQWRTAEEIAGQGLLAAAVLALNGGYLHMGSGHLRLHEELAPGGADANDLEGVGGIQLDQRQAGDGGLRLELRGALHRSQRASPPWSQAVLGAKDGLIGVGAKNMNREDLSFTVRDMPFHPSRENKYAGLRAPRWGTPGPNRLNSPRSRIKIEVGVEESSIQPA